MSKNLYIPIVLGSGRKERRSEHAAKYVLERATAFGQFATELLDVRDFVTSPVTERLVDGGGSKRWQEIVQRADGLIIVAPEYNHSFPGELKLLLDQLYREYHRKPAAICGVSKSSGGTRMTDALRGVLMGIHMVATRTAVHFTNVRELFDEHGKIKDDSYAEKLEKLFDELVWYARALKEAREGQ